MSEIEHEVFFHETRSFCSPKPLFHSFIILLTNSRLFLSIFALTTFPLSLILFVLFLYSAPLKAQIYNLEALAAFTSTPFEARHVSEESRSDSLILLRVKFLFFLPSYALSILATIASVNSTVLACSGKRPNFQTAFAAVQANWKRPLVTSVYVFGIMLPFEHVLRTLPAMIAGGTPMRWVVAAAGAALEVYVMAVLSLAMVVSVVEERSGWDAVKMGWWVVEEKRFCWWVLAGFLGLVSGGVWRGLRVVIDGQDWMMEVGLICLCGFVILWSYVVITVYYFGCSNRTRHVDAVDDGPTI